MKISMAVDFRLLRKGAGDDYIPVVREELENLSIGGYCFHIGDKVVPFDWTAYTCNWDENGTFLNALTGYGWMNDFELDECYDEEYAKLGIKREDISAKFLASAHYIDEFFVYFDVETLDGPAECCVGSNTDKDSVYKVELLKVVFEDIVTEERFEVVSRVLEAFNKGEEIASLDSMLSQAKQTCEDVNKDFGKIHKDFTVDNIK